MDAHSPQKASSGGMLNPGYPLYSYLSQMPLVSDFLGRRIQLVTLAVGGSEELNNVPVCQ